VAHIPLTLDAVGSYQSLVSKNLEAISSLGSWDHRMPLMGISP
jgi:hypothetical protein